MSMLAGPRRKQKVINLRAKNNAWSNDTNKFGQRMLEKMGWSSGKGLGAKENGIVEHVVARYKNDEKGLGFEDKNDQWTKHEDDFNALLANLSSADTKEPVLHSGVSLEVKSKKSKARIHYHKFTRGKDLSRYSEKDLANIFGKKSLKNESKTNEPERKEEKTEQIFTDKGSMDDYFKNKMASFKLKNKIQDNKADIENEDYGFQGFASIDNTEENHQGFGFQPFSFYNSSEVPETEKTGDNSDQIVKKKKKSKTKVSSENPVEFEINSSINNELEYNEEPVLEKKSKRKNKFNGHEISEFEPQNKKIDTKPVLSDKTVGTQEDIHLPKKKKKRKNKEL